MRYVKEHAPPLMIMENVPQVIDPPYENLAATEQGMKETGYSVTYAIVDANAQGSVLQRKRAYFFAVHKKKFGLTSAQAEVVLRETLRVLEKIVIAPTMQFADLLLDDASAIV